MEIGVGIAVAIERDVLEACGVLPKQDSAQAKQILDRIVAMLTKLGKRG